MSLVRNAVKQVAVAKSVVPAAQIQPAARPSLFAAKTQNAARPVRHAGLLSTLLAMPTEGVVLNTRAVPQHREARRSN